MTVAVVASTIAAMKDVSLILAQLANGDSKAEESLLPLVYAELRQLAAAQMKHESADHTLQATALVHEAYFRLFGSDQPPWQSRAHFFSAAAEAMRRILIESARRRNAKKRGADFVRVPLETAPLQLESSLDDILDFDAALSRLAAVDSAAAKLVELRVFGGLSLKEAAEVAGISERTAYRNWSFAQAWLFRELKK